MKLSAVLKWAVPLYLIILAGFAAVMLANNMFEDAEMVKRFAVLSVLTYPMAAFIVWRSGRDIARWKKAFGRSNDPEE